MTNLAKAGLEVGDALRSTPVILPLVLWALGVYFVWFTLPAWFSGFSIFLQLGLTVAVSYVVFVFLSKPPSLVSR